MIVEFTGCTGSGKTTVSRKVIDKLIGSGFDVVPVHQEFFGHPSGWKANGTVRNLVMDIKACGYILKHARDEAPFLKFCSEMLRDYRGSMIEKLNIFRSVCRKLGTNGRIAGSRDSRNKIVIFDEGIVHSLHNLFVQRDIGPDMARLAAFSDIISLPDVLVYVRSPLEVLMARAKGRHDLTRRARGEYLPGFIKNAERVFEEFVIIKKINGRVFTIDNSGGKEAVERLAGKTVEHILKVREHAGYN